MPRPDDVERKKLPKVESEKSLHVGAVVFGRASQQCLYEKQRRHHEEEPRARCLSGGQFDGVWIAERETLLFAAVPTQNVPPSKDRKKQARPSKQYHKRKHAPDDRVGGSVIFDQRFGGPVDGIRVSTVR